jgi:hypothetical protein
MEQNASARQRTRRITIVALDPSFRVKRNGRKRILMTQVDVPAEGLMCSEYSERTNQLSFQI